MSRFVPTVVLLFLLILIGAEATPGARAYEQQASPITGGLPTQPSSPPQEPPGEYDDLLAALWRLPLAAALGTALALRPKRKGTPARTTAVVQTQILLAVVGAVIMLVVGASLARAFGIVGAANLIRYRSKIEDPKDAVVMLCSLAVGLAAGVGLYQLAIFSTAFLVAALWAIESFEPESVKLLALSVKKDAGSDEMRRSVEALLTKHGLDWDIRTLADDQISYQVEIPVDMKINRLSDRIARLGPEGQIAVSWDEQKKKKGS